MQTYVWCCFACGSSNAPGAGSCAVCECPAQATVSQLERFRGALVLRGIAVSATATHLHEPPELSALEVLSPLLCVLSLGMWPWVMPKRAKPKQKSP